MTFIMFKQERKSALMFLCLFVFLQLQWKKLQQALFANYFNWHLGGKKGKHLLGKLCSKHERNHMGIRASGPR